jgi:hypothetical protein
LHTSFLQAGNIDSYKPQPLTLTNQNALRNQKKLFYLRIG